MNSSDDHLKVFRQQIIYTPTNEAIPRLNGSIKGLGRTLHVWAFRH
jgi:hypothetical protein